MAIVTYYTGAGASFDGVPLAENMMEPLFELRDFIIEQHKLLMGTDEINQRSLDPVVKVLLEWIEWLSDGAYNHATIDTFAKKLSLTDPEKLKPLKMILGLLFTYWQNVYPADSRYDTFFASIIQSVNNMPSNIRMITWNYDFQIEKTFSQYSSTTNILENAKKLGVIYKGMPDPAPADGFRIIKLNGTSGIWDWDGEVVGEDTQQLSDEFYARIKLFHLLLDRYKRDIKSQLSQTFFSFAWEGGRQSRIIIDKAKTVIFETNILVIIGYSFPFFNRQVDKEILESMNQLRRIYIQDPDAENIKEKIIEMNLDFSPDGIITKTDKKQFFLPIELDVPETFV